MGSFKEFQEEDEAPSISPTTGRRLDSISESTPLTTFNNLPPSPPLSTISNPQYYDTPQQNDPHHREFRLEDYLYILSSLQHRNPYRIDRKKQQARIAARSVIPPEIPRPSPHEAEDSDLFVPALHSLATLCVHKPSKGNVAIAFAIGGKVVRSHNKVDSSSHCTRKVQDDGTIESPHIRRSTIYVAQSGTVPEAVEEHLKDLWARMQAISKCLEEKRRPSSVRSSLSYNSNMSSTTRSVKRSSEGKNLRSELLGLERAALAFSVQKVARRVMKRWDMFDKFIESLKKDRTRGDVPKGTAVILSKIRTALESPVKTLNKKKNHPEGLSPALLRDLCDELIYAERVWKRESVSISEVTFGDVNAAATRFSRLYNNKHKSISPVTLTDVRKYIDKIFLIFDHCHVLEELAYSWGVVDILNGELDVVRVDAQYTDVDNLPTLESEMQEVIEKAYEQTQQQGDQDASSSPSSKEFMDRYLKHLRMHPLIKRDSVRVPVHYECNLISYIHRNFAVPAVAPTSPDSTHSAPPAISNSKQQGEEQKHIPFPYLGVSKLSCDMCRRYIGIYNSHCSPTPTKEQRPQPNSEAKSTSSPPPTPKALPLNPPPPSPLFKQSFSDTPACVESSRGAYYAHDGLDLRGITTWTPPSLNDAPLEAAIKEELLEAVQNEIRKLKMPDPSASSSSANQPGFDGNDDVDDGTTEKRPGMVKAGTGLENGRHGGRRGSLMARLGRLGSFSGMIPGMVRKGSYSGNNNNNNNNNGEDGQQQQQQKRPFKRGMSLSFEVGSGRYGFFGKKGESS